MGTFYMCMHQYLFIRAGQSNGFLEQAGPSDLSEAFDWVFPKLVGDILVELWPVVG